MIAPEEFGDNWSDELDAKDREALEAYVRLTKHLETFLGFITFRVGGKDFTIDVAHDRFDRGLTVETPRASLMTSVEFSPRRTCTLILEMPGSLCDVM